MQCAAPRRWHAAALAMLAAGTLTGCPAYAPVQVDPKTGQYSTMAELEPSAIREFETSVDPRNYRFVVLMTSANIYPARFQFFVRKALADLGLTRVLNGEEYVAFVRSHPKLQSVTAVMDPLAMKRVSDVAGPIMMVQFDSYNDGNARQHVTVRITDASSGKVLFRVEQNKMIWANMDSEVHYPVLNALRRWFAASTGKPA